VGGDLVVHTRKVIRLHQRADGVMCFVDHCFEAPCFLHSRVKSLSRQPRAGVGGKGTNVRDGKKIYGPRRERNGRPFRAMPATLLIII